VDGGQGVGHVVGEHDAVAGQIDRGLQKLRQRELAGAVFLQRQRQPGHGAGDTDAERGIARFGDVGLAVGPEKNLWRGRGRRGLAIVDGDVLMTLGRVDHHEAAAADIARARIAHGQREAGGDRRIDRVAALAQYIGADPRPDLLLRHHHAVFGDDGMNGVCRGRRVGAAALLLPGGGSAKCDRQRDGGEDEAPFRSK